MQPIFDKKVTLQKYPGKGGWTYALIPEIKPDKNAYFGWVKVKGSIDGYPIEKFHLVHLFGNGLLAYIFTAVAVICGAVVFSVCAKWVLNKVETFLKERVRRVNHV